MVPFLPLQENRRFAMHLAPRDQALLLLLDRTPATASQILKASATFDGGAFRDERRTRERLQSLGRQKLVHSHSLAVTGGGLANYYTSTAESFRLLHGPDVALPHRSRFAALPPSRLLHSLSLADVIVHVLVAAHNGRMPVTRFHRENELVLEIGPHATSPDCHLQLTTGGRLFNMLFEVDRSTEPLDSPAENSIRTKILAYEAYQEHVLGIWKRGGGQGPRPYFRVVFLTTGIDRAHNILGLAQHCARNRDRKLCYAATFDEFLSQHDALREPLFLDHHGNWRSLVDLHPSASSLRSAVRINPRVQPTLPLG
jgi:hypothetical protein